MADLRPLSPDEAYDLGRQYAPEERPPQTRVKAWRLFALQRLLREKPRAARELAAYFGVTVRSIQRDLEAMRADGVGLACRDGLYSLAAPPPMLNAVEALAVHAAARLLYHHSPAHNKHYREGLIKLAALLPEPARGIALRSTDALPQRPEESHALELVAQAWFGRQVLRFDYAKPGQPAPERGFELQVYFVEIDRTNLSAYVIGFERARRHAMRTFKLSRMQHLILLREHFDEALTQAFDPTEYLSDAWGVVGSASVGQVTVRLRFAPEAAYRIREGGYRGLIDLAEQPDGHVTVSLHAGVDGSGLPREVIPWILSWGPRVEVLGPANVRAHWLGELRAAVARYGGDTL